MTGERWRYQGRRWMREPDEVCPACDRLRAEHGGKIYCEDHYPPLRFCTIRGCEAPVPRHRTDAWLCDEHAE